MVRNRILPLGGVIVALALAGCAASPLYVQSGAHRGTVGEIPRDGNGEPMWDAIPRPLAAYSGPAIPPAPGIPITGPGVAEMQPPPVYAPAYAQPAYPPPAYAQPAYTPAPAYVPPPPAAPPPVAYRAPVPQSPMAPSNAVAAAAPQPLYPAPAASPYVLSPLSPDATKSEIRKRARDRRRACAHLRDCPPDIRP